MKLTKHIFLVGFMGCGKSTNAARLADVTGAEQMEMDKKIVEQQKMAITDIFAKYGELYFRDLETEWIRSLTDCEPMIISCGGGAVLRDENVELMKQCGSIVLLTASPETIFERVRYSNDRPLLNGNMNVTYIAELIEKRRPRYEAAADVVVATDGKTVCEICDEILRQVMGN